MKRKFWLILFYGFANHLPDSYTMIIGRPANKIRIWICSHIFRECGKRVSTINRNIYFGNGKDVCIGDYSGIGANSVVPKDIKVGKYVMMGPDCYCVSHGHQTSDPDTPMCFQGAVSGGGYFWYRNR